MATMSTGSRTTRPLGIVLATVCLSTTIYMGVLLTSFDRPTLAPSVVDSTGAHDATSLEPTPQMRSMPGVALPRRRVVRIEEKTSNRREVLAKSVHNLDRAGITCELSESGRPLPYQLLELVQVTSNSDRSRILERTDRCGFCSFGAVPNGTWRVQLPTKDGRWLRGAPVLKIDSWIVRAHYRFVVQRPAPMPDQMWPPRRLRPPSRD